MFAIDPAGDVDPVAVALDSWERDQSPLELVSYFFLEKK